MIKYWQKLDSVRKFRSCSATGICVCFQETEEEIEEDKIVRFLLCLNDDFVVVISNIFLNEQVSHIDKVYEKITQEEQ